jgi:NAD(P)-dependent dehydrogenase (short-subunit alcohol dehydrogenase family)
VLILITGATSGLGRYLAERLTARGDTVLVHGRDPARVGDGYVADLSSLAAVNSLADSIGASHDHLDVLVNNAALGFGAPGSGRQLSKDGHELRFAVNYLAPVLLTRRLLPLLRSAPSARIVNVGSLGQEPIDFTDLDMSRDYDGVVAYRRSKLALAAYTFDLAEELRSSGIAVNCIHPATYMDTGMVREAGVSPVSSVSSGGDATLRLITSDVGTGNFFNGTRKSNAHPQAYDPEVRRRLREVTEKLLRQSLP